jgi:hypothetical protein
VSACPNPLLPNEHLFQEKWKTTAPIDIDSSTDHKLYIDLSKIEYMQVVWKGDKADHWKAYLTGRVEPIIWSVATGQRVFEALKRLKAEVFP